MTESASKRSAIPDRRDPGNAVDAEATVAPAPDHFRGSRTAGRPARPTAPLVVHSDSESDPGEDACSYGKGDLEIGRASCRERV
jgi:hypothetical protein